MLKRAAVCWIILLGPVACSDGEQQRDPYEPRPVAEVESAIEALNGRTVSVRGWLTDPCEGYSCAILPTAAGNDNVWVEGPYLSIAAETLVEPRLTAYQGREVVLRGVISSQCRSSNVRCTDRAPDITPISVAAVSSASKDK